MQNYQTPLEINYFNKLANYQIHRGPDFKDYKFSASALPEFTSFQIKVVFNGTNSAYPARLKDFRAIALAV